MEKVYMVVAYGMSKKTGEPYSRAYLLRMDREGRYAYLDSKDQFFTNDIRAIGEVLKVEQKLV